MIIAFALAALSAGAPLYCCTPPGGGGTGPDTRPRPGAIVQDFCCTPPGGGGGPDTFTRVPELTGEALDLVSGGGGEIPPPPEDPPRR